MRNSPPEIRANSDDIRRVEEAILAARPMGRSRPEIQIQRQARPRREVHIQKQAGPQRMAGQMAWRWLASARDTAPQTFLIDSRER